METAVAKISCRFYPSRVVSFFGFKNLDMIQTFICDTNTGAMHEILLFQRLVGFKYVCLKCTAHNTIAPLDATIVAVASSLAKIRIHFHGLFDLLDASLCVPNQRVYASKTQQGLCVIRRGFCQRR